MLKNQIEAAILRNVKKKPRSWKYVFKYYWCVLAPFRYTFTFWENTFWGDFSGPLLRSSLVILVVPSDTPFIWLLFNVGIHPKTNKNYTWRSISELLLLHLFGQMWKCAWSLTFGLFKQVQGKCFFSVCRIFQQHHHQQTTQCLIPISKHKGKCLSSLERNRVPAFENPLDKAW